MDIDWSDNNLSFFLNDNKSNLLIGLNAFQGEGDLIDDMLLTNTKSDKIVSSFVPIHEMHILDKKSFFKKYLDNALFYIAMNFVFWFGLMFLIDGCSK